MPDFVPEQLVAALDPVVAQLPPATQDGPRPAAVLALFCFGEQPDLLVTERAHHLSHHAGQISFPGGGIEVGDDTVATTALRETHEEIGLEPSAVTLLGQMPQPEHTRGRFRVSVLVGSWSGVEPLTVDETEVAAVHRYPLALLVDPRIRFSATMPNRRVGPAFVVDDIVIWGFTALLIDSLLDRAGWTRPWDRDRLIEVPQRFRRSGF